MQTTSLPFQVNGANGLNGQSQNMRGNAALTPDGVDFGATLTRQLEQRQLAQQAPAQPPAAARPQAAVQPQPPVAARLDTPPWACLASRAFRTTHYKAKATSD
ncbi:MAG: hypothetical protein AB1584_00180, partial [Pseudomonadota bacterium]